jgi:hypothetical protein
MYKPNPKPTRNGREHTSPVRPTSWWKLGLAIPVFAATILLAGCFEGKIVTTKVVKLPPNAPAPKMNGVFYALPRTVVKVDVPVNRVDKSPGEFADFKKCFFPNDNFVATAETTEFSVVADKIKFDTTFTPDTQQVYMIKTNGGKFETKSLELALTESGVFVKASAESNNQAIDVVTGTIKSGVGLLAKASSLGVLSSPGTVGANALTSAQTECETILGHSVDPKKFENALTFFKKIEVLQNRRDAILDTVTPNATVPADTLKLTLDELDKTIKELKQSGFLGSKDTLTWNSSFRLNPSDPAKMSVQLFSISKDEGICQILAPNQGVLLSQIDPRFTRKNTPCANAAKAVSLELKTGEDGEGGEGGDQMSDRVKDAKLKQEGDRGFYYRVPGRAIAFVYQEGAMAGSKNELGRAPLSIAQFGEVVSLPASAGGRKTKYSLDLYESSGGLKNFVMGSSALIEKGNVEDLTGAAGTAIDAAGERKKAKAPASELDQLKQQREILEEKKKIRDLQKALEGTGGEGSNPP